MHFPGVCGHGVCRHVTAQCSQRRRGVVFGEADNLGRTRFPAQPSHGIPQKHDVLLHLLGLGCAHNEHAKSCPLVGGDTD